MTYTVIYERGPSSWGAYVPDLPGVISVGESQAEVATLIQEAIEFHLDGLRDEGLPIPLPACLLRRHRVTGCLPDGTKAGSFLRL